MSTSAEITALVEEHFVRAALQASRIEAVAGDGPWSADLELGTLEVGGRTFFAELIGTESEETQTFLWGWDHPSVPPGRATLAQRIHDEAGRRGIGALLEAYVSTDVVGANEAAILGVALAGGDAWWLAPDEVSTGVLLVRDDDLADEPVPLVALPRMLLELGAAMPVDLRRALEAFAADPLPGVTAEPGEDGTFLLRSGDDSARLELDELGRLGTVRGELSPSGARPRGRRGLLDRFGRRNRRGG